ncbi:MAG: heme o synthase [Gemmatimonadota bacterium]|jgi:protoheme IX farnesyltransferase|nr:protoheme IX farnesyltransferase [Gemmatimonadota bacterium]MDP6460433.1 heme o synthase [Gemmatimonadota bacterium]MDP6529204.1 heme o synthase [Gemmatimonadota bacterium]MDP6803461.1 heme o synthase [Gemmatimonadota bacterium]MDP7031466.1 heme o synthase [Gemmatimonadota bacterium]
MRTRNDNLAQPVGAGWVPYAELTKPRLVLLVLMTVVVSYLLAGRGRSVDWSGLVAAAVGTGLVGGGANGVNQVHEARLDARMHRTRGRPIPSSRLKSPTALLFALAISAAGLALLVWGANLLTGLLGAVSWVAYVVAYTPMKRLTSLNTLVGAVPGAIPPLMGWAAASGRLEAGAFVLFAMVFIWQVPHFMAIAWLHREDYARAGFRMLPVEDPEGRVTFRVAVAYSLALIPVSLMALPTGLGGGLYAWGAVIGGGAMLGLSVSLARRGTEGAARRLFVGSIVYMPAVFGLLLLGL